MEEETNVVSINGTQINNPLESDLKEVKVDDVLATVSDNDYEEILILGFSSEGEVGLHSTPTDLPTAVYRLELLKNYLLQSS